MKYLVGWGVVGDRLAMRDKDLDVLDARSTYDAEKKFIRRYWTGKRDTMQNLVRYARAKCTEDSRFTFPADTTQPPEELASQLNIRIVKVQVKEEK